MTIDDVADELYALPPEEFTAARTAAAQRDKAAAKAIGALRKPTVGAWLVNTLARAEPELLDQLLALGPALAEAQRAGQGDELRALGAQRRDLVAAVADRAFEVAGRAPSAATRAEVESTLEAALADPATSDAVRSGRLVRPLSYAGFGGVDLDGAVAGSRTPAARPQGSKARPGKGSAPKPSAATKAVPADRIVAAEARANEAAGALDDAVRACQAAQEEQNAAEQAEEEARAAVTAAEDALRAARTARTDAENEARRKRHRTEQAAKGVLDAQQQAERARAALDRLRRQ